MCKERAFVIKGTPMCYVVSLEEPSEKHRNKIWLVQNPDEFVAELDKKGMKYKEI